MAIAVSALTAAGLITAAGPAAAQPQPTVSQVQAKLNKLTNQENWLIQRYDKINEEWSAAKTQLKLVEHEVATDQQQVNSSRSQVAQIASAAYEDGSLTSDAALITSSSAQSILSQSAILVHLSTSRQQQLRQYLTSYRELASARMMAKRTESAVGKLHSQIAAQQRNLNKLIAQQKALLSSLTAQQQNNLIGGGSGGGTGGHDPWPTKTQAEKAVAYAYAQLGCHYVYGSTGPCSQGFDCSGLMQSAWAAAGVSIPRDSYGQATLPHVSLNALHIGDILLFAGDSHVGMYVGGGYLIDAPQPGMNVEKVSMSASWYAQNIDGAVRP